MLVMHRVRLSHAAGIDPESGIVPTLRSLKKLTYVDVSDKRIDVTTYRYLPCYGLITGFFIAFFVHHFPDNSVKQ